MATSLDQYQQAIVNADSQLIQAQTAGNTELADEILADINKMVADMKVEHPDYQPTAVADTSISALDSQLDALQVSQDDQSALLDSATTLNDGAQPIDVEAPVVPVGDQSAVNQLLAVAEDGVEVLQETEINSEVPVGVTEEAEPTEWKKEDSIIAEWGDGKFIIELPNGKYNFLDQNAGVSTTDPAMIKLAMDEFAAVSQGQEYDGMTTGDRSKLNYYEDIVSQDSFLARGGVFQSGYLFVGEGIDEAYEIAGNAMGKDGEKIRKEYNLRIKAFKETRPKEYMAWKAAGAVYSTLPAIISLPTTMYTWMASLPILPGVVLGSAASGSFQAVEGAVSGWLSSEGGRRGEDAIQRGISQGMFGLMLGGLIPVAPKFLAWGWHKTRNGLLESPINQIAKAFDISKNAAKLLKKTVMDSGEDLAEVLKRMRLGGTQAMVGDATEATKVLVDMIAASGNEAAEIVSKSILGRSQNAAATLEKSLDKNIATLPEMPNTVPGMVIKQDAKTVAENLAIKTAPARDKAYKKAYETKIDYNSEAGLKVLDVLTRTPNKLKQAAMDEANQLLQMEGKQVGQMVLTVGDDGLLKFVTQPNMVQLDYLKRALSELAYDPLKVTGLSKAAGNMRFQLTDALKKLNPAYQKALKLGQEKITRENAIDIGEDALKGNISVAQLSKQLNDKNIGKEEREMVAMGLRASLDRIMGNVRATANIGADVQAMKKVLSEFSSSNAKKKLRLLIPDDKEYKAIIKEINKSHAAINLQSAVNINSKTYTRTSMNEEVKEVVEGGVIKTLSRGEPTQAVAKLINKILRVKEITDRDRAVIMKELATVLVEKRGGAAVKQYKDLYNAFKNNAMNQKQLEELTAFMASRLGMKPIVAASAAFGDDE
tara:strand:+ start:1688 stop:4333 length:2646 start_codon:yes stop_codon:yes gene_type:complete